MTSATLTQPAKKTFGMKKWMLAAAGLLLVGLMAGAYAWYQNSSSGLPAAVDLAAFEEVSGFRPKMIAVTAAGGIVDLRYKVTDPLIVERIMANSQTAPRLMIADSGQVMDLGAHHVLNEYLKDATYFMFYPNVGGVVQTGTELWVIVEGVRYGPIVAK